MSTDNFVVKPENIYRKPVSKKFNSNKSTFTITIADSMFVQNEKQEILLDEVSVQAMVRDIAKALKSNTTKYNPMPSQVIISHSENSIELDGNSAGEKKEDDFLIIQDPSWTMDDVYIDDESKRQLLSAIALFKHKETLFNDWGLKSSFSNGRSVVLNFYGPPGTGKSMMAEALASYLGKKLFVVNYAELESKYVGETPKNIRKAFKRARDNSAVLVFDEADSFLGKRLTSVSQAADYGVNITRSVMLFEVERYDGVVIFTTNLLRNYDEAFKRRIFANIEFKMPDEAGRKRIWDAHIPKTLPIEAEIRSSDLASRFSGITGADIKDILLYAAINCLEESKTVVDAKDFDEAYKTVQNRYEGYDNITVKHSVISQDQYEEEVAELKSEEQG